MRLTFRSIAHLLLDVGCFLSRIHTEIVAPPPAAPAVDGPTGTPVKDAQRTKTDASTKNVIVVIWGTRALPDRTAETVAWYRAQMAPYATIEDIEVTSSSS